MYAESKKQQHTQPFTPLTDNEFFFFTRLGREDLLAAYIELKRHCWTGKNFCWPSAERQAEETGRKLATVRRRLQDLEQLGVIRVIRAGQTGQRGNRYILTPADDWEVPAGQQPEKKPDRPRSANYDRVRAAKYDRRRSPKQIDALETDREKTNNQKPMLVHVQAPRTATAPQQDVVVLSKIAPQTQERLQGLGVQMTPSLGSNISRFDAGAVERALGCLESARKVDNPAGYFLAALKGNWVPPVSFLQAKAQKHADTEALQHQTELDALARIWGVRVGLSLDNLECEIQRDVARTQQPIAERVQEWVKLGRGTVKAESIEDEHDKHVQTALAATEASGLMPLIRGLLSKAHDGAGKLEQCR